jgi:hypothetical protein
VKGDGQAWLAMQGETSTAGGCACMVWWRPMHGVPVVTGCLGRNGGLHNTPRAHAICKRCDWLGHHKGWQGRGCAQCCCWCTLGNPCLQKRVTALWCAGDTGHTCSAPVPGDQKPGPQLQLQMTLVVTLVVTSTRGPRVQGALRYGLESSAPVAVPGPEAHALLWGGEVLWLSSRCSAGWAYPWYSG